MNALIIGCGAHSQRIYVPMLKKRADVTVKCIIDIEKQRAVVDSFLEKNDIKSDNVYLRGDENEELIVKLVSLLKEKHSLDFAIISTEPLSHFKYAHACLKLGLSILLDKPITTREFVSTDAKQAKGLIKDFDELKKEYQNAKKKNPKLVFELMAQRRFHKSFRLIKSLLGEIFNLTQCPVTSIQSFHGDGQWRSPQEIIELNYHPYNQGYGKASHSGYHSIDIINWLIEDFYTKENRVDNIDVVSFPIRPADFVLQIPPTGYKVFFKDCFNNTFNGGIKKYLGVVDKYGEIDCFSDIAFKKGDRTVTLASVNLAHNSFSQRGWPSIAGRDLYKGNGRVRHESYYILQGPFQAISISSYQSTEILKQSTNKLCSYGGEFHFDIHVFRNDKLFPQLKNYQFYSIKDVGVSAPKDRSRGHQEDARRECIDVFLKKIVGSYSGECSNDILLHEDSTIILSGIYQSLCKNYIKKNPLINLKIK